MAAAANGAADAAAAAPVPVVQLPAAATDAAAAPAAPAAPAAADAPAAAAASGSTTPVASTAAAALGSRPPSTGAAAPSSAARAGSAGTPNGGNAAATEAAGAAAAAPVDEALTGQQVTWAMHASQADALTGKKPRRQPIYSVDVHPDGTRFATGGRDPLVKIWNLRAALDPALEADPATPRLLAALTGHSGVVLAVRFSPDGRYLASGSDDQRIFIHALRDGPAGLPSFGVEASTENWAVVQRLSGHETDVVDLAWSRDGRLLASCGLDSAVNIWDMTTYRRVAKLSDHTSAVKGVAWDPSGVLLATQSDDNTVKLWKRREHEWECVQSLSAPTRDNFVTRLG